MIRTLAAATAVAAVVGSAHGAIVFESEPNDTLASADFVGTIGAPGGAIVVDGGITTGDVDWISFELTNTGTLVIASLGTTTPDTDSQFQLVDSGGTILEFDDDDGPGLLPAIQITNLPAGVYTLGISTFADVTFATGLTELFDGIDNDTGQPTDETYDWKVTISANVIPAPGVAGLLGLAGVAAIRRLR